MKLTMRNLKAWISALLSVGLTLVPTWIIAMDSIPSGANSADQSLQNRQAMLKYLLPVLKSGGKNARVYFRASCSGNPEPQAFYPRLDIAPPFEGQQGLTAVRAIFRNVRDVGVTESGSGIIRIRIGSFPDKILKTQISTVALDPTQQYNAMFAVDAITEASDVQAAMKKQNIKTIPRLYNMLTVLPAEGLPHLDPLISNVTMDQALDSVTNVFKGVVLYGACEQPRLYLLDFAGGVYRDESH